MVLLFGAPVFSRFRDERFLERCASASLRLWVKNFLSFDMRKILVSGPVSRILFCALRRFGRHFSQRSCERASRHSACAERREMRHTRGCWTGRPAAYFALHRTGFALPPPLLAARWALTPPFHHHRAVAREAVCFLWHCPSPRLETRRLRSPCGWRSVLPCGVRTFLSEDSNGRGCCPRLGIKELGATARPQNQGGQDGAGSKPGQVFNC
jgi:hypothetical protein